MKGFGIGKLALIALLVLPTAALGDNNWRKSWDHPGNGDRHYEKHHRDHHYRGHRPSGKHPHGRYDKHHRSHNRGILSGQLDGLRIIIGGGVTEIGYHVDRSHRGPGLIEQRRWQRSGYRLDRWQQHQQRRWFQHGFGNHPKAHRGHGWGR